MDRFVSRLMVGLDGPERSALAALAREERRDVRQQAAVLIRQALVDRGFLEPQSQLEKVKRDD